MMATRRQPQKTAAQEVDERLDPPIRYALEHSTLVVGLGATMIFIGKVLAVARLEPGIALALVTSADTARFLSGMFVSLAPTLVSLSAILSWLRWTGTVGRTALVYLAIACSLTALTVLFSPLTEAVALLLISVIIVLGRRRGTIRGGRGVATIGALGAVALVLNYVVRGPLWMPSEALTIESRDGTASDTQPYYVVEEEGPWLTVLRAEDLTLQRIRLESIVDRALCRRDYNVPVALINVLAPPVEVAGCGYQGVSGVQATPVPSA